MSSSGKTRAPALLVERCMRRFPPQLETARHVLSASAAMAFAAATRTGSAAPSAHFSTAPSPVAMSSSSAARESASPGAPPAGSATETSPEGNHWPSPSLKSATADSSPSKARAACSFPVRGLRAALAATKEEPPRGSVRPIFWHGQWPFFGRPEHSASAPLLVATRRPASPHVAPSTSPSPSTPPRAKGEASPPPSSRTSTPSRPRASAATAPAPLEASSDGCCSADHFMSTRCSNFCTSAGDPASAADSPRPSASGASAATRRCASCMTSMSLCASAPISRRSQPPVWHHSLRVPRRDQGDIQGCMWDGQRMTRPSCLRNMRSPLICSMTRPMQMYTHMPIIVRTAPRKSFQGQSAGIVSLAFLWNVVGALAPLAAFISCCRQVCPGSSLLGGATR
mmetsp:Transcript_10076/g.24005  ORF Transcript_10076/g.24005 Transcript_10076/m.24005 type:complete len:398 (+) Transcript_10076:140-1333(+)